VPDAVGAVPGTVGVQVGEVFARIPDVVVVGVDVGLAQVRKGLAQVVHAIPVGVVEVLFALGEGDDGGDAVARVMGERAAGIGVGRRVLARLRSHVDGQELALGVDANHRLAVDVGGGGAAHAASLGVQGDLGGTGQEVAVPVVQERLAINRRVDERDGAVGVVVGGNVLRGADHR